MSRSRLTAAGRFLRPALAVLSTLALSAFALQPAAAQAAAGPHSVRSVSVHPASTLVPAGCPTEAPYYVWGKQKKKFTYGSGKKNILRGDPGDTISISVAKGHSWTFTATGTVKGEASALFASAEVSFSVAVAYSRTTTVTMSASHHIPKSASAGYIALGTEGRVAKWKYGRINPKCEWVTIRSGRASIPRKSTPVYIHSWDVA